jgi:hypothetical protein
MLAVGFFFVAGCGQQIDVVDSGTYEGTITEVNAEEEEIYVALDNDPTIELYFKEDTVLKQGDSEVPFSALQKDQKVRVTVERVGNRLDPKTVEILD